KTTGDFLEGLRDDLDAVVAFKARHGERVQPDVFEVRLPEEVLRSGHREAASGLLSSVAELVYEVLRPSLSAVFYEAGLGPGWRESWASVLASLAEDAAAVPDTAHWRNGFKLRCGGLDAAAVPSVEQVAFALTACRDAGVPLKATAGLHHPLRRFDPSIQAH